MLSYSKQSPWYAHTHPDENEFNFFTAEIDDAISIKPQFDYYDIDEFKKAKSLVWKKTNSVSIIHTNICSLQANIDKFEDLLHDLDFSFALIALTETWHSSKNNNTFLPKKLTGHLDYIGTEGSSKKGGCGLYVKDTFTPIPRKDLEFNIRNTGSETESYWIELVNSGGPNILVGVYYRHPSSSNDDFIKKLKSTLKKANKEKNKNCYLW